MTRALACALTALAASAAPAGARRPITKAVGTRCRSVR